MNEHLFDKLKTLDEDTQTACSEMYKGNDLSSISETLYWARQEMNAVIKENADLGNDVSIQQIVDNFNSNPITSSKKLAYLYKLLSELETNCKKLNIPIDLGMMLSLTDEECPYVGYWTQSSMHC